MGNRVFVAIETGSTEIDGDLFSFHKGQTRVDEGHPLVKQCPDLFAAVEGHLTYGNETADEPPRRGRGRRGPKKAEKAEKADDDTGERNGDGPEGGKGDESGSGESKDETPADLSGESRDKLNDIAASLGVENPDKLQNKGEVIKAIEAAQKSE